MYLSYLDYNSNIISVVQLSDNEQISLLKDANRNKQIPKEDDANNKIAKQYLISQEVNLDEVSYMFSDECPEIYVNDDLVYIE